MWDEEDGECSNVEAFGTSVSALWSLCSSEKEHHPFTQAEIDHFWRKKKLEEEEHRLAHEEESARNEVKTLKASVFFFLIDQTNFCNKLFILFTA